MYKVSKQTVLKTNLIEIVLYKDYITNQSVITRGSPIENDTVDIFIIPYCRADFQKVDPIVGIIYKFSTLL